ncbi:ABC transporter ATP-binding protein [Clostridium butyricum]|uniref:ABC transporter ATP-binding protein n=2 Tax=Clostridium butyricum TaxID=1492 RepID=UPI00071E9E2F|nr:ABC transporter ATP-binding protein [Clostridium butyricum]ALR90382.1 multidrug ABC transporter ATP-binding protein [Clostridium butyricum]ALS18624.1 multidrug ABC transporter ATP-binding protein [Clostridium butyricum]ANF15804.1 multidrug ABC transporter ATP-binding protein [Clostridium butyricum]AOR95723.1 multidrug ABC transporter ATP-binding protein [Clostridium butyricum]MCI3010071.1 ABC transporter ATP-binding protein/permease [Clostridium butyricum]
MKYLKLFLKESKGKVGITLIMLLGQSVGTLLIPFLIAGIVDNGILKGDINEIMNIGGQMILVLLITTVAAVLGSYYSADLAAVFGYYMRDKIFRKSQELSIHEFDTIGVSSMITRTTSDISNLQQTFGLILQLIVPAPLIIISSIIMTIHTSFVLALIIILSVVIFMIFASLVLKKSIFISKRVQTKLDYINQVIRECITGIRVIRAFGNEKYEEDRAGKAFKSYATDMIKLNKIFAVLNPTIWLIIGLSIASIVWIGGVFSMNGTMEIGQITAVTEYSIITLSYLILATTTSVTLPKMKSCLDRIEEVLEINLEIQDLDMEKKYKKDNYAVVEFENVSFFYNGAEEPVIRNVSFSCNKGETTAIIGSTGSGKSTIANLILRLHDIDEGEIRINGVDIRCISQKELRDTIGYVPQKAFLFSGTIEDNLKMGYKDATKEDMKRALSISQSDSFVDKLPDGLKSEVSQGGSNFSGGQKQRLSIARALIRSVPIYIFDDSFSALDLKTDSTLRKSLKENMTESAKIIIAQRVSTIMDADQIIVLDEGKLVGVGKHIDLMKSCSVYQAIAKSQMSIKEA